MAGAMRDASPFDPGSIDTFRVTDWELDPGTWTLRLRYSLDGSVASVGRVAFEERVDFALDGPGPGGSTLGGSGSGSGSGSGVPAAFGRAVDLLHLAAGVSYYKAAAPGHVVVERPVPEDEAAFARLLYDEGLREFAVANGLGVPVAVDVRGTAGDERPPPAPAPSVSGGPGRALVPVGGGKDSFVLAEALRPLRPLLFAVNPKRFVVEAAVESGFDLLVVRRTIDPALLDLNRRGALNGHVPITAIVSLLAVAAATLTGCDRVVMAVERSASEETAVVGGVAVNHQFSKGLVLERALAALVADRVDPSLRYGSALRPYSELAIARAFAGMPWYHHRFVSCNAAYRLDAQGPPTWCGACPKCRFVALVLAPFLGRDGVAGILGRDLFAEPGQVSGFAALFGPDKPYECVGERLESAVALASLAERPEWRGAPVVAALAGRARALVSPGDLERVLAPEPALAYPDADVAEAVAAVCGRGRVAEP